MLSRTFLAPFVLLCAVAVLAPPSAAAQPRLLAAFGLDESSGQVAHDGSGNGNDGRLGSTAQRDPEDPTRVDGVVGGAFAFAGSDQVAIPDTSRLEPQRLTVEAWVRRIGSPGRFRYVLSKGALECNRSAYGLYTASNGGLGFYVADAQRFVASPLALPEDVWDGTWHHVAGTYDGHAVRLVIDGAEVGAGSAAQLTIAYGLGSRGVYIGTYQGSCVLPFSGDIDEVRIWGEALSASDIAAGSGGSPRVAQAAPGAVTAAQRSATACFAVAPSRRSLVVGRSTRVAFAVRDRGRPLRYKRVTLRGAGLRRRAFTDRRGVARVRVRARFRAQVSVTVAGQRGGCRTVRLVARR